MHKQTDSQTDNREVILVCQPADGEVYSFLGHRGVAIVILMLRMNDKVNRAGVPGRSRAITWPEGRWPLKLLRFNVLQL